MKNKKLTFCWVFCGNTEYETDDTLYRSFLKNLYLNNPVSCLVIKKEEEVSNNRNIKIIKKEKTL